MPTNKSIIVLQENTGYVQLFDFLPAEMKGAIQSIIDRLAESFEDIKTKLQTNGKYDTQHFLTNNLCTRANLLTALVDETKKGRTIDLIVLGHGSPEKLVLNSGELSGGVTGNIKSLKTDAQAKGVTVLKLRMVYMCNCYGNTVSDDWLAAGAKVSVGSVALNSMPEPTTTFYINNWLAGDTAARAAQKAFDTASMLLLPIFPPLPRLKFKQVEVPYPCVKNWLPAICKQKVLVPDGVDLITDQHVKDSALVVQGAGNTKY